MDDSYLSSSPSINEEEIDFQYVYALRTFVATEQGQANVYKGDAMILLNDSNSYWWLVRLVKDSSVGFLPAEHVETPSERLARLNKHRNGDVSSPASFSYNAQNHDQHIDSDDDSDNLSKKHIRIPNSRLKKSRKSGAAISKKSVKFTPTLTYVSASEYDFTDHDYNEDEEFEYSDFEESDEEDAQEEDEKQNNQKQVGPQQKEQVYISHQDPLVIRKPRSNSNSPQSSSSNIVTNSDDEGASNNDAAREPVKRKPEEIRKSSGIFTPTSKPNNSNLSSTIPLSANEAGSDPTPTSPSAESTHSRQASSDTIQSTGSVVHHSLSSPEGSQKRRSLLKTKSSTEQLKFKPSSNSASSISPINSSPPASTSNGVSALLKKIGRQGSTSSMTAPLQSVNTTSTSPSLGNSSTSSSSRSSPSSNHSQTSSTTSPDLIDSVPQSNGKVDNSLSQSKESEKFAKRSTPTNRLTAPLNTSKGRVGQRASMFETRSDSRPDPRADPRSSLVELSLSPDMLTPRRRTNANPRQTHSEIYSNNPFRASMTSDFEGVTAPLQVNSLVSIPQGKATQQEAQRQGPPMHDRRQGQRQSQPLQDRRQGPPSHGQRIPPPSQGQRKGPPIQGQRQGPPIQGQRQGPPNQGQRQGTSVQDQRQSQPGPGQPGPDQRQGPPSQSQRQGPPIQGQRQVLPSQDQRQGLPAQARHRGPNVQTEQPGPTIHTQNSQHLVPPSRQLNLQNEQSQLQGTQPSGQQPDLSTEGNSEEIKKMIPERAPHRSPLLQHEESPNVQGPGMTGKVYEKSDGVSSILSLPISISSDQDGRSGSAMTVSTSPSSPVVQDEKGDEPTEGVNLTQSKDNVGYLSAVLNSCKIHPDIVPIFKETSVRLDQMNDVSICFFSLPAFPLTNNFF